MKTIVIVVLALISLLSITFLYQNQESQQEISSDLSYVWKGFHVLFSPERNEYCLYTLNYNYSGFDEVKLRYQLSGKTEMIGKSPYNRFCKQYTSDLEFLINSKDDYTRFYYKQAIQDQRWWNYYGQTDGQYVIGQNIDTQTFVDRQYEIDYQVFHSIIMYDYEAQFFSEEDNIYEQFVQSFGEFENKDKKVSCSDIQGDWYGTYLAQYQENNYNCQYDAIVKVDGTNNISRIIGEGVDGKLATTLKKENECYDQYIDFVGLCDNAQQSILSQETDMAVFNENLIIVQTKNTLLTLTRK